ncbi:MAG TPA: alpha/beta hydrolase [Firmicutes bacterium]|nr:alpha/beta hydrolase [Bacillota bacterium]
MQYEKIALTVDYSRAGIHGTGSPCLYAYLRSPYRELPSPPRPAVVICPGGGYQMLSDREGEGVALRFLQEGFQCFVLHYSVAGQAVFPGPQLELASAVALVRRRASEWTIDPDKIVVCGFSAGGHLAGSLGMFWNRELLTGPLGLSPADIRPNGMILGYPVITSGEFAHRGSFQSLLGERYEECLELASLEKQVTADTPPAFLWHTWDDDAVPVENSLLLAAALRRRQIPLEMHILASGPHGLALATEETGTAIPACADWPDWASRWIREL